MENTGERTAGCWDTDEWDMDEKAAARWQKKKTINERRIPAVYGPAVEAWVRSSGDTASYIWYYNLFLENLTTDEELLSAYGKNAWFDAVLCRDDRVILIGDLHTAAGGLISASFLLKNKKVTIPDGITGNGKNLAQQLAAAVRRLQAEETGAACWRFPQTIVGQEHWRQLAAKRILEDARSGHVSEYGASLGLAEMLGPYCPDGPEPWPRNVGCSPERWEQLQTPPAHRPYWEQLPLSERWDRIRKYGGSNPGHFVCELQRLMKLPFDQLFETYIKLITEADTDESKVANMRKCLEDIKEEYRCIAGYMPDTYLEAVRELVRICLPQEQKTDDFDAAPGDIVRRYGQGGRKGLEIEANALTIAFDLVITFKLVHRWNRSKE